MENISQEPTMSVVERQKLEASEFVADRINELMKENKSSLEAARIVYEEVKGNEYRKEQATAKLLEFLTLANEVHLRSGEINTKYPAFTGIVANVNFNNSPENDAKYLTKLAA